MRYESPMAGLEVAPNLDGLVGALVAILLYLWIILQSRLKVNDNRSEVDERYGVCYRRKLC